MEVAVLVRMANDIANFFEAYPNQEQAAQEIATHLKSFWDPLMRRELLEYVRSGGEGLHASVKAAAAKL